MLLVYTPIVDRVPTSFSAEVAPSIGDIVGQDGESAMARVVRSADRGRIFIGEPRTESA